MVDLVGQYNKIKPEVDSAIQDILSTAAFINGPHVKRLQENLQNYLGVKHVIPCANGTDALQVAMMALNLEPGDEVITTTFTFIATAEVIALLRLKPVLVDIEKDSYNIFGFKSEIVPCNGKYHRFFHLTNLLLALSKSSDVFLS